MIGLLYVLFFVCLGVSLCMGRRLGVSIDVLIRERKLRECVCGTV